MAHADRGTTKRERVMAALRGDAVDRVPIGFWGHNYATENSAQGLADESLRLARTYDWDYLKPQSRAQSFAEMWGLTYTPSTDAGVKYTTDRYAVESADDLAKVKAVDPRTGALGQQLEALDLIRAAVGPNTPIIWTVFSPLMVTKYLVPNGVPQALDLARSEPTTFERALEGITETLVEYARACLEHGADGLFYATNVATRGVLSVEEVRRLQHPYDRRVLAAVESAPFNVMHVCGSNSLFSEFVDYPVAAFSWAVGDGNPTLSEGHRLTGKAVLGGLPTGETLAKLSPEEARTRAKAAVDEMGGRWLLLGPGCSIAWSTSGEVLLAAGEAARAAEGTR